MSEEEKYISIYIYQSNLPNFIQIGLIISIKALRIGNRNNMHTNFLIPSQVQ